ncbi:domain of Kin17 curved DNA-binding protein-domain-containing protein [Dioszegia hungarica]|uniref:Domain of Kin17 curved DNA-binding protein-domain-containing protein n=1 Tax=Dioszegia hungarica TaxID=4972 RepID=A0AA38HE19_9TREE|nr:domain of Kin17 curved DNA-binding protein-domain-containing protein [Dioszegia hungarica]KAI9638748.1 domain of Kin17 curved DNA-binding protein-domain-containing protein [Dioszegia hungarica]
MGKAEAGSTKAAANAIKAKGLGRLRWYCQVCEKQCRDENGFQAHCRAESHLRKILLLGPKAGSAISDFSSQFQSEFMTLLRTRHLTNRVQANKVYNEYIQDKHHVHMNSTRWVTLAGFVATIGKAGLVRVEEDEKGLWISWVDNRPETLSKQAALQKRDRATMDGEERERHSLAEQIERAKAQEAVRLAEAAKMDADLVKKEGEKITLSFAPIGVKSEAGAGAGPSVKAESREEVASAGAAAGPSTSTSLSFGGARPGFGTGADIKPLSIANPLKRPAPVNVFKAAKVAKVKAEAEDGDRDRDRDGSYTSEAERLMREDQARKGGRGGNGSGGGGYGGIGPVRTSKPNLGRTY